MKWFLVALMVCAGQCVIAEVPHASTGAMFSSAGTSQFFKDSLRGGAVGTGRFLVVLLDL